MRKRVAISKPIFIIGCPRSGSTLLHRMLSYHPQVAWFSSFCDKYPDKPWLNRLVMVAIDTPIINFLLREKTEPEECYGFWDYYSKEFRRPIRDLVAEDVRINVKDAIHKAFGVLLTKKRHRLLIKITGWPRIGYLKEIFPDAIFVHIVRDGKAVVNSLLNVDFWWGWTGPQNWRFGELEGKYKSEWENSNKSFVVLAALQWKIVLDAVKTGRKSLKENEFLEIKYEDLTNKPVDEIKRITEFCGLEWSKAFELDLNSFKITDMNSKWKAQFTNGQQQQLKDCLRDHLKEYGYQS